MRSFFSFLAAVPAILAAPVMVETRQDASKIANSWIIRLNNDAVLADALGPIASALGVEPTHTYEIGNFKGLSVDNVADALGLLTNIASIASIEPNTVVTASELTSQANPPYGLARISHREPGATEYIYDSSAGEGTFVYVIDTGIYTEHNDFGGRATFGATFVDGDTTDGNGHGTHCAGTVAGRTYGVSKRANIIGVKVLGATGSGLNSAVLAGIDWSVNNARQNNRISRSVISMSLGGGFSQMTNDAVAAAVRAGVFTIVAAGNDNADARETSPASEPTVFTVGAIDKNDARASFSNFGPVVDIFAAGVDVVSASNVGNSGTRTLSGTSMACPHVAGLAAYIIGLEGPRTPAALGDRLKTLATKNVVTNAGAGSPNNLAYNGSGR